MKVTTIEEASVDGNLLFHDDVYVVQLRRDPKELSKNAIPTFADQLTNARIRGAQAERVGDVSPWETRQVFQLGIGLFHLTMNFAWCLLNKHRLTPTQHGSLSFYFLTLDKKRLAGEKPDYHTLMAALGQIRDGLLLNAWRQKSGTVSLKEFAASRPTPESLEKIARDIFREFATPLSDSQSQLGPGEFGPFTKSSPQADIISQNTRLLLRDLLYLKELEVAISSGDFGRIEDILPDLAAIFRGAGSNNYCTEILHLLHNLKRV